MAHNAQPQIQKVQQKRERKEEKRGERETKLCCVKTVESKLINSITAYIVEDDVMLDGSRFGNLATPKFKLKFRNSHKNQKLKITRRKII